MHIRNVLASGVARTLFPSAMFIDMTSRGDARSYQKLCRYTTGTIRLDVYYSKLLTEHFIYMNIVGFKGFSFSVL